MPERPRSGGTRASRSAKASGPASAPGAADERLRLSARSVVLAVAMFGATLAVLRLLSASARVLGWIGAAAAVAGLLHPVVDRLSVRLPRAAAIVAVVLLTLGGAGLVTYGVVDTVVRETRNLQRTAPEAARDLERSDRFGEVARTFDLERRTTRFVDAVPERLRGGEPGQALRAAATRGVAFLATGVLSLFFLIHGQRLVRGGLAQIRDDARRERVTTVLARAYRRAALYAAGSLAMSILAGLFAYGVADVADLHGAAALGVWVALWDLVPVVGVLVGALPLALLALPTSITRAALILLALAAYEVAEVLAQRRLERRSVRVGPFLTVAAGVTGIEIYGLGGGLVAVLLVALTIAVLDETVPAHDAFEGGTEVRRG